MIKAAIVGCGKIAYWHISAINTLKNDVRLVAVCDRDKYVAQDVAARLAPSAQIYDDFLEMLDKEKPDVVHVLTSPDSHAMLSVSALEAGAHVLVEKPMVIRAEEAAVMIDTAHRMKRKLCVNHNYLYKPSIVNARRLVASGSVGEIVYVDSYYGLSGEGGGYTGNAGHAHWAWQLPGGAFANFLPHLVYLQLAFMDSIESVLGVTVLQDQELGGAPTDLTVLLQGNNTSGTMAISMRAKPYAKFVDIYGTNGIIHADLVREICTVNYEHRLPRMLSKAVFSIEDSVQLTTGTVANTAKLAFGGLKNMPGLHELVRLFYLSIRDNGQVPVPGEQGKRVAEIMDATWAKSPLLEMPPMPRPTITVHDGPRTAAEREFAQSRATKQRILVTGATGFLGYQLIEALARCGADVTALVRNMNVSPELERQTTLICGDVRDAASVEAATQGIDIVFHCAAVTTNNATWSSHYDVNVMGTKHVLEAARMTGVKRVIHVSSVVVYGLDDMPQPALEDMLYSATPDTWAYYMRSKLEADKLALRYALELDQPVTVLRLGILYGPGGGRAPGRGLVQLGRFKLTIGNGHNRLPYTYVGNATDCLLLAAITSEAVGEAYSIVDEPQITSREVMLLHKAITGDGAFLVPVPPVLLNSAARLFERKSERNNARMPPKLSHYVVRSACRNIVYDTSKAQRELGWRSEVSLEDGMRRTLESI